MMDFEVTVNLDHKWQNADIYAIKGSYNKSCCTFCKVPHFVKIVMDRRVNVTHNNYMHYVMLRFPQAGKASHYEPGNHLNSKL